MVKFAFIAMLALLSCGAAAVHGASIQITHSLIGSESNTPAPAASISLRAFQGFGSLSESVALTIPSLAADSMDRILNYAPGDGLSRHWVITEANGADFGMNWNEFAEKLNGDTGRTAFGMGAGQSFEWAWYEEGWLAGFELDRIEIDMEYYFWHPVLTSLRGYRIDARIFGEARIVPEPTSWLLALLGACAVVARKSRWTGRG